MSQEGIPIPPPTFEFLVLSIKMQAEMQLGLMNFGQEKDAGPDLAGARHAIDILAMLAEKTRGNLAVEEQRLIENSLTELRFRFVQASREAAAKPAATAEPPAERVKVELSTDTDVSSKTEESKERPQERVEATFTVEATSGTAAPAAGKKKGKNDSEEDSSISSSGVKVTDRRSSGAKDSE